MTGVQTCALPISSARTDELVERREEKENMRLADAVHEVITSLNEIAESENAAKAERLHELAKMLADSWEN